MDTRITPQTDGSFKIKLNEKTTIYTKVGQDPEKVIKKYENIPETILTGVAAQYFKPDEA